MTLTMNPALDVSTGVPYVLPEQKLRMVGGIVLSLARGRPLREAMRFGVAAGAAAVMNAGTELCQRADVERLYPQVSASSV
jgi:fructose-1-phosphate kinase PfkB-like protein